MVNSGVVSVGMNVLLHCAIMLNELQLSNIESPLRLSRQTSNTHRNRWCAGQQIYA